VIEKQGIFRALLEAGVHNGGSPLGDCIIVTGCGYPDVATRALVSRLSKKLPDMIIIGVADYNPHGISLLLTYKFGSRSNRALEARGLAVEKMHWLGLRLHQVEELLGDQDSVLLLPMTDKDAGVAAGLVEHACFLGPEYGAYLDEVERMLQLGIKCELQQALMGVGEVSIEGFIIDAILREDYI
jgi:meiotic recombination protein SPO11